MKVSVVVPVYNMAAHVRECLESLAHQTLDEIEIVVVDDGSTDSSSSIIAEFSERFPLRIRHFRKENGGLSDARNFGIEKCVGEYIGFVDSDDYAAPEMFELLYREARRLDAELAVCPVTHVFEGRFRCHYFPSELESGREASAFPELLLAAGSYAWNKLYKRSLLRRIDFSFPVGRAFEDSAVVYNVMLDANRIATVNKPLYFYRRDRAGSITSTPDSRIFDIFHSCESILSHFRQHSNYASLQPYVASICVRHVLARIRPLLDSGDRTLALSYAKNAMDFLDGNFKKWKSSAYFSSRGRLPVDAMVTRLVITRPALFIAFSLPISWRRRARLRFGRGVRLLEKLFQTLKRHSGKSENQIAVPLSKLEEICRLLDSRNAVNFIDFGTLLGAVRNGGLIPGDKDIDIGILGRDPNFCLSEELEPLGLRLWRRYILNGKVIEESYTGFNLRVDFSYYECTAEFDRTWLFFRKPGITYFANERNVVEMRYQPIGSIVKADVSGATLNVPARAEELLGEKYGHDWRKPDPGWIYWQSPAAIDIDALGTYIQYEHRVGKCWKPVGRAV